jgi:TatD DNase family protein
MMTSLVDSHCHIPLLGTGTSIKSVLAQARELGVGHMLCASIDLESYPGILVLAQEHASIFASVGVHPNTEVKQEPSIEQLVELAADNHVVAIGETGLDYFRSQGDLEWQRERFRTHIRAAKEVDKPLIIHSREAKGDVIEILAEEGADKVGGVMHCFVDDWETAQRAMGLNFYISFSGIVTFKNASELKSVAKQVPLDHILVETDSPYLAPVPYRGKQNQPAYVYYVARHIAELRGTGEEEISTATTDNFFRLFKNAEENIIL